MPFTIADARIRRVEAPVDRPVVTAFGRMDARQAVFLEIVDDAGRTGLGESWVNFPHWAAFERVVAFDRAFLPYLRGRKVSGVPEFSAEAWREFSGPAAQAGTTGPLLCALCAIELALYDLAAQEAAKPLRRFLFDDPDDSVRVYASGISSPLPIDLIDAHLAKGVTLFKLKLGFGDEADRANLEALRNHLPPRAGIAVDVNRGWTFPQALRWLDVLADLGVEWLEEPLRAEEESHLFTLSAMGKVPIALGENILMPPPVSSPLPPGEGQGEGDFGHAHAGVQIPCEVLQPDITKYTPLSVALSGLPGALHAGKRVIPHFLGSAPGEAASLQFAAGCPDALCELDINPNPLRTEICDPAFDIKDGRILLPDTPGLGWRLHAGKTF